MDGYSAVLPGLRVQAFLVIPLLVVKLALSYALAVAIGAPGPVVASVVVVLLFQVVPNWVYVKRRIAAESEQRRVVGP